MKRMKVMVSFLIMAVVILSACTQAAASEATPDLGAVKTQAVQTAVSQMTADAESGKEAPASTSPTITPLTTISAVVLPTATTRVSYSSGSGGSSGGSSSGTSSGTPIPTATPDVYICEVIGQTPLDGNQYVGADIDVIWTLKNVGVATWTAGTYYYHWTGYSDLSPVHSFTLTQDVPRYSTVQVMIDVRVPIIPGQYRTQWYMVNDNGENFCGFYYYVNAIPLPTATPD
ncbi:MAG TPA: NBR1-Ig-like domain-containing protein [Anaerolineaceae bacterium]|nr:NBR1-Ig-like domain-containing protein [Anaerolineaceae bacterium]